METLVIIPYLSFNGCCEEAVSTYIRAFGGEIHYLSRWTEETSPRSPELVGKVMHAEFVLGGTRMSGGDSADCAEGNSAIKLMVHMDSRERALHAVDALAQGGKVISPLKPHPAPDDGGCGSITKDRFGYTWIVTCPNLEKK